MKEATGEVSMTVVTLVAIAAIGAVVAFLWPNIKTKLNTLWGSNSRTCLEYDTRGNCTRWQN